MGVCSLSAAQMGSGPPAVPCPAPCADTLLEPQAVDKSLVEELPAAVRRIFYLSSEGTHIEHEVSAEALGQG